MISKVPLHHGLDGAGHHGDAHDAVDARRDVQVRSQDPLTCVPNSDNEHDSKDKDKDKDNNNNNNSNNNNNNDNSNDYDNIDNDMYLLICLLAYLLVRLVLYLRRHLFGEKDNKQKQLKTNS